jgi:hypothetical protein
MPGHGGGRTDRKASKGPRVDRGCRGGDDAHIREQEIRIQRARHLFRSKCAKMSRFPELFAMETWMWGGNSTSRVTSEVPGERLMACCHSNVARNAQAPCQHHDMHGAKENKHKYSNAKITSTDIWLPSRRGPHISGHSKP